MSTVYTNSVIIFLLLFGTDARNYNQERKRLMDAEMESSFGSDIILTEMEKIANEIIMRHKKEELKAGFEDPRCFNPSRHFFEAVNDIKKSELFKIIRKMPKGGILHSHMSALASTDFIVSLTHREHLWQLCTTSGEIKEFRFAKHKPQAPDYDVWQLVRDVRARMGSDKYDEYVRPLFTLYDKNGPEKNVSVDIYEIWEKFHKAIDLISSMTRYEEVAKAYSTRVLEELAEDNVQYIEMRNGVPRLHDLDGKLCHEQKLVEIQQKAQEKFIAKNPSFIGSRVIYASLNFVKPEVFDGKIETAKKLHEEFPNFVVGFDVIGPEDSGNRLSFYEEKLREKLPKEINLFLHAGETNWYGNTDENLIDAILLGSRRIGHAFALLKHPEVMEFVKTYEIPIEVSPISNQVLRLIRDQRNHPASVFMANNMPMVISSDDPSYWESTPLSHDFYITFLGIASAHGDLRVLKKLAMNSIKYSAMNEEDKEKAFAKWQKKWDAFIEDIVASTKS